MGTLPRLTPIPHVRPAAWRDSLLFIGVVSCVQSEFFSNKSLSAAQRVVGQEARMETLQRALEKKQQNRLTVLFPFGHQGAFLQQRFYVENFDERHYECIKYPQWKQHHKTFLH